jgi:hypothetical protein
VAGEILAKLEDANAFLDEKANMGDGDDDKLQIEANRIIKSMLFGVFTTATLANWSTPSDTPGLIRGIAGRLIAAYYYKEKYSEDTTDIPEYAQDLYNQAIGMLRDIRAGLLTVLDDTDTPVQDSGLGVNETWFWPNDTTDGPVFTMGMEFG